MRQAGLLCANGVRCTVRSDSCQAVGGGEVLRESSMGEFRGCAALPVFDDGVLGVAPAVLGKSLAGCLALKLPLCWVLELLGESACERVPVTAQPKMVEMRHG